MSGFTPGPWFVKSHPWPFGFWPATAHDIVTEDARGRDGEEYEYQTGIASIRNAAVEGGDYPSGDEAAANARLIAAAPELLAALEAFVDGDNGDSIDTRYENARQAIVKARGDA